MRYQYFAAALLGVAQAQTLDQYVTAERARAIRGVLANIGPNGSECPGCFPGVVVASPSTVNPNYFYTWIRDSALTMRAVIDEMILGNGNYQQLIDDYVNASAVIQTVANPSGTFANGAGLGEPKFYVNETRFNGAWGRPQRDGPALRAIALMEYITYLLNHGQANHAKTLVWPVVINDLNYVGQYWNQSGFDLWEEVYGSSFFTLQAQHRALTEGVRVANSLARTGDPGIHCSSCVSQAPEILCFLQSFWNGQYLVANINTNVVRSGLDANTMLGAISNFDIDAYCDSLTLQPCNSKQLATFKRYVDSFRNTSVAPLNAQYPAGHAVALGRYTEDVYYGGNPWYLITTGAAEFLYDVVAQLRARHSVTIDNISLPFYQEVWSEATIRTYQSGNANSPFEMLMRNITAYADGFVAIVEQYTPANGSLFEQFNKTTGAPVSAIDLTWSFAEFVTMSERRAGQYPPSWGSRTAAAPPSQCTGTSAQGTYVPAFGAGAPNVTFGCTSPVLFRVLAPTYYGENIYLLGDADVLGNGDVNSAAPMYAYNYTATSPLWFVQVELPPSTTIGYQYARSESDGSWILEATNRTVTTGPCGGAVLVVNDTITTASGPHKLV